MRSPAQSWSCPRACACDTGGAPGPAPGAVLVARALGLAQLCTGQARPCEVPDWAADMHVYILDW